MLCSSLAQRGVGQGSFEAIMDSMFAIGLRILVERPILDVP